MAIMAIALNEKSILIYLTYLNLIRGKGPQDEHFTCCDSAVKTSFSEVLNVLINITPVEISLDFRASVLRASFTGAKEKNKDAGSQL